MNSFMLPVVYRLYAIRQILKQPYEHPDLPDSSYWTYTIFQVKVLLWWAF